MNNRQLKAFLSVAQTRSFAESAETLHVSQPALSLSIKKLEESLGGRLLTRSTRSVSLTPEGQQLFQLGQRLMAEWDGVEDELKKRFSLKLGKVAVAAMPSVAGTILPSALMRFHQAYPNIQIEVHDVVAERVVELVRAGRLEIGVSFDPGQSEDLQFYELFEDRFVGVLPETHPLIQAPSMGWADLLKLDFIALQRPSSMRSLLDQKLSEVGLAANVMYESHQLNTIGRMVVSGLGVSAVPELSRPMMEEMGAFCVPLEQPHIARRIGIITHRRSRLSVAATAMRLALIHTFC